MLEARREHRLDFGYIVGDPFALATISISLVRVLLSLSQLNTNVSLVGLVDRIYLLHHCQYPECLS